MIKLMLKDFYGPMFEDSKMWDCFYYMEKFLYFGARKTNLWRAEYGKKWDSWEELASEIKKNGILKPIIVSLVNVPEGKRYAIQNGYHRVVAGHIAGLKEFPCEVI